MRNNNKILTIAVVILLLANIALVAMMLMGKGRGREKHDRPDPAKMMAQELNMTEQQQKDYAQLREEHFKNVKPYFDSVRIAKTAFFALTKDANVSDSVIEAYSNKVAEKRAELDKFTFEHFRRVRNLFTAEQQPKYDSFIQKMMQRERGKRDSSEKRK